jgi:predicted MFS family arabinose efflux permease
MLLHVFDATDPSCRLAATLLLNGLTLIVLWPVSTTLAPLIVFSVMNGIASGGFFSLMPTVAGQVFGSARVAVALGMLVTGWSFGYLMVSAGSIGVHLASG